MGILLIAVALLISLAPEYQSERVTEQIDQLLQEYRAPESREKVEHLVVLDGRLRKLLHEPWQRAKKSFDKSLWKPSWSEIGVYVGHYSGSLDYSSKLLVEAHRINPSSVHRCFTLFSRILGERTSHGLGEMPDLQAALQYLHDCPDGPFADEASIILGHFYNDLFKVLKDRQADQPRDYKSECFSKYVEENSLADQASTVQRLSIRYYSQALDIRSKSGISEWAGTKDVRTWKLEMEQGEPRGWHFCAD
jgi:hypothetical protein